MKLWSIKKYIKYLFLNSVVLIFPEKTTYHIFKSNNINLDNIEGCYLF